MSYTSGFGLPSDVFFDVDRAKRLFQNKWFFVGTRGDLPKPRDFFTFELYNDEYALVHGSDGQIHCYVNRCAHQSARLFRSETGGCSASVVCPNHQWSYSLDSGRLRAAPMMGKGFADTELGKKSTLTSIAVREVAGMLFACLGDDPSGDDTDSVAEIIAP
jgi:Rieske 2Fe-2S family protein